MCKLKRLLYLVTFFLLVPQAAFSENDKAPLVDRRKALFYPLGQRGQKALFTQDIQIRWLDDKNADFSSIAKDTSGAVALTEEAQLREGRLKRHIVVQEQINEKYQVEVIGSEALFKTFKKDENGSYKLISERTTKLDSILFSGPAVEVYLRDSHQELIKRQKTQIQFAVFELERPIQFKMSSTGFNQEAQKLNAQMKIDNFLFSLFLDPIDLEFDLSTKKIIYYKGRTPLRIKENNKWKPWDAEIDYSPAS